MIATATMAQPTTATAESTRTARPSAGSSRSTTTTANLTSRTISKCSLVAPAPMIPRRRQRAVQFRGVTEIIEAVIVDGDSSQSTGSSGTNHCIKEKSNSNSVRIRGVLRNNSIDIHEDIRNPNPSMMDQNHPRDVEQQQQQGFNASEDSLDFTNIWDSDDSYDSDSNNNNNNHGDNRDDTDQINPNQQRSRRGGRLKRPHHYNRRRHQKCQCQNDKRNNSINSLRSGVGSFSESEGAAAVVGGGAAGASFSSSFGSLIRWDSWEAELSSSSLTATKAAATSPCKNKSSSISSRGGLTTPSSTRGNNSDSSLQVQCILGELTEDDWSESTTITATLSQPYCLVEVPSHPQHAAEAEATTDQATVHVPREGPATFWQNKMDLKQEQERQQSSLLIKDQQPPQNWIYEKQNSDDAIFGFNNHHDDSDHHLFYQDFVQESYQDCVQESSCACGQQQLQQQIYSFDDDNDDDEEEESGSSTTENNDEEEECPASDVTTTATASAVVVEKNAPAHLIREESKTLFPSASMSLLSSSRRHRHQCDHRDPHGRSLTLMSSSAPPQLMGLAEEDGSSVAFSLTNSSNHSNLTSSELLLLGSYEY